MCAILCSRLKIADSSSPMHSPEISHQTVYYLLSHSISVYLLRKKLSSGCVALVVATDQQRGFSRRDEMQTAKRGC